MAHTSDEATVVNGFWTKLVRNLTHLPFADEVVAAYYCAFDPATPLKVKGMLVAALAYFILPLDVVPDILLGIGFTDDFVVLMTTFTMIRGHLNDTHRAKARETLERIRRGETPAS
jgi:uncharacterized membrane protein YkvA (DUF1232 family)